MRFYSEHSDTPFGDIACGLNEENRYPTVDDIGGFAEQLQTEEVPPTWRELANRGAAVLLFGVVLGAAVAVVVVPAIEILG